MTPDKDKKLGVDDAAVGLEEEKTSAAGEDGAREDYGPADIEANQTTAGRKVGRQAPETDSKAGRTHASDRAGAEAPSGDAGGDSIKKAEFQEVSHSPVEGKGDNLDLLLDVVVPVSVELGRTSLTLKDILSTCQGSVIELDRAAGEPVDIMVGGKPLARGDVVVVKDRFGVRITKLIGSIEGVTKT